MYQTIPESVYNQTSHAYEKKYCTFFFFLNNYVGIKEFNKVPKATYFV